MLLILKDNIKFTLWIVKANFICSLLVWFISRINIYFINKGINNLVLSIFNAIIFSVIILLIAYYVNNRNYKKFKLLIVSIIIAIYTISLGLLSNLILPLCSGDLVVPILYTIPLLILIIIICYFTIKLNLLVMKNICHFKLLLVAFGIVHYFAISMTLKLNYINFYEHFYNSLIKNL
jgi:hypothetical protein